LLHLGRLRCLAACIMSVALFVLPLSEVAIAANGSVSYFYDPLGRIVLATYDTGVCLAYSYDPVGNRTSETIVVPAATDVGIWDCSALWDSAKWGP
jgi:YD repeat-containing protein